MKHKKVIQPSNHSELSASALPDRSDLSRLYASTKENRLRQEKTTVDSNLDEVSSVARGIIINRTLVSLLLSVPLIATYLAAIYIYHGSDANIEKPDPFFPLVSFFVSGLWLTSCVISLRILAKRFYNYNASFSTFIIIYLFFVLPLIKLTYDLFPTDFIGIASTIATWIIGNYLIVLYMTWSLNRSSKSSVNKIGVIILPILILMICAALL